MKRPLLLLAAFIASLFSFAQGTISGTVVDADTKQPLEGASVFAQNTTRGTMTDKDGNFRLHLEKGGYEINVTFTGYTSRTINLEVTGDRTFNLELQKGDNTLKVFFCRWKAIHCNRPNGKTGEMKRTKAPAFTSSGHITTVHWKRKVLW
ncbi:MAG: carboxypeptidase-like regulatory domain-containing protein [Chitinophagaceae bacterium]|nr:MAG: carboxypeptidase-like regulatory domain-containing protein [Chitinophagaceae bacterium]